MGLPFFVEPLLSDEVVGTVTFYPQAFSPDGRYIISKDTSSDRTIWTLDRTDESCITAFGAGGGGLNLVIDNDGTVYSLDTAGTLCSWPDFARGSQTVLASDCLIAVSGGLGLFVMPDESRKVVWIGGGAGAGSADISIWDVTAGSLTIVANGTPTGLTKYQQILQDSYGDVWAVGSDATNIYFQRVIDNGAGSGSPDFNAISDPGRTSFPQIEAYHTSAGWFVCRGGGTDLYLLKDDDFSAIQHRSYAANGSVLNSAQDAGSPFLMGLAPGEDTFWFPGPASFAGASYSDFREISAADLTSLDTKLMTDWDIGDVPKVGNGMVVSTHTRLAFISMQNGDNATAPAFTTVLRYFPLDAGGGDDQGTSGEPVISAWGYNLDGHRFYLLRLGTQSTMVYDRTTRQWAHWASPSKDYLIAHIGGNWLGIGATTLNNYAWNVIGGDDTTGNLWVLDPNVAVDDNRDGSQSAFTRKCIGAIPMRLRQTTQCAAVYLLGSLGEPALTGQGVMLETSDDNGHSWTDEGTVTVTPDDYSQELNWMGLGLIRSPGRLFRFTDSGALTRISSADIRP